MAIQRKNLNDGYILVWYSAEISYATQRDRELGTTNLALFSVPKRYVSVQEYRQRDSGQTVKAFKIDLSGLHNTLGGQVINPIVAPIVFETEREALNFIRDGNLELEIFETALYPTPHRNRYHEEYGTADIGWRAVPISEVERGYYFADCIKIPAYTAASLHKDDAVFEVWAHPNDGQLSVKAVMDHPEYFNANAPGPKARHRGFRFN